jgi:1,4-dihydroxy-2-naphthoyl-CoA hydrolase
MKKHTIWKEPPTLETLNDLSKDTMVEHLEIVYTEIGDDYLKATMPVDERTVQPMGLLHGGASAALAETLGSVASYCIIDRDTHHAVGLNIEVHHIRSVTKGTVTGMARPLHIGKTTHLWEIRVEDEKGRLVSMSMLRMIVLSKG